LDGPSSDWERRSGGSESEVIVVLEYRGVQYSIPSNDDGVWRYKIHPGHTRKDDLRPDLARAEGYPTHGEAIEAAKRAVDFWLLRKSN
jgi:hypothetical protein